MKKYILIVFLILIPFVAFSQVTIQMEEYGGVYRIPCTVNGAKMKLIFDTGAANVCLSQAIAEYLLDNDYISTSDFISTGQSVVADGRIVDHLKINLRDIEVAGLHLKNIPAVVVFEQQAPLLLGQSAIEQLGLISISGDKLIIHKADAPMLSEEEINDIFEQVCYYWDNEMWASALDGYEKLYLSNALSDFGLNSYSYVLHKNHDYEKALKIILEIKDINHFLEKGNNIYETIGERYYFAEKNDKALPFLEKAILFAEKNYTELIYLYDLMSGCNMALERYKEAADNLTKVINYKAYELGVEPKFLIRDLSYNLEKKEKSVKDDYCDRVFIDFLYCENMRGRITDEYFIDTLVDLCVNGQRYAIRHCERNNINWESLYYLKKSIY